MGMSGSHEKITGPFQETCINGMKSEAATLQRVEDNKVLQNDINNEKKMWSFISPVYIIGLFDSNFRKRNIFIFLSDVKYEVSSPPLCFVLSNKFNTEYFPQIILLWLKMKF